MPCGCQTHSTYGRLASVVQRTDRIECVLHVSSTILLTLAPNPHTHAPNCVRNKLEIFVSFHIGCACVLPMCCVFSSLIFFFFLFLCSICIFVYASILAHIESSRHTDDDRNTKNLYNDSVDNDHSSRSSSSRRRSKSRSRHTNNSNSVACVRHIRQMHDGLST